MPIDDLSEASFGGDDYRTLLYKILTQAMDDYIKLMHPRQRSRVYLQEALDAATDMFFDKKYEMLLVKDSHGEYLTLKTLIQEVLDDDTVNLERIKTHVIDKAHEYWQKKDLSALFIPDSFVYQGHIYSVFQTDEDWSIDFSEKIIHIDKTNSTENQERFMQAVAQIIFYHADIPLAQSKLDQVGKGIFQALRMNACFLEK
jgi:hypothetical protein